MNEWTHAQVGSPSRDAFKRRHKDLNRTLYACDLDFVLIEKDPTPDIVAALDYKQDGDDVSFSEVIAYNALIRRGIKVFIVTGDAETGCFEICEYIGGHHRKPTCKLSRPCTTRNWKEFENWEQSVRQAFRSKFAQQ